MTLTDLPGTKGQREGEGFQSVSGALAILRRGIVAAKASDNGAVAVWRDDNGTLRCERMMFRITQDAKKCKSLKEVAQWLKINLPLIER